MPTLKGYTKVSQLKKRKGFRFKEDVLICMKPVDVHPGAHLRNDSGQTLKFVYADGSFTFLSAGEELVNRLSSVVMW